MSNAPGLDRFVGAQEEIFAAVLDELHSGTKKSHWMWYIFPQLAELGRSDNSKYYGLASLDEACSYLAHPVLGGRLRQCLEALMSWSGQRSAEAILGPVDAMKLRSSLTLFDRASPDEAFAAALDAFFAGEADRRTLALLNLSA